jgi:hypothetical protein
MKKFFGRDKLKVTKVIPASRDMANAIIGNGLDSVGLLDNVFIATR